MVQSKCRLVITSKCMADSLNIARHFDLPLPPLTYELRNHWYSVTQRSSSLVVYVHFCSLTGFVFDSLTLCMYGVYNTRVNLCIMLLVFVVCCLLFVNSSVPSEHDTGTQWLCGDVSTEVLEARILQQLCDFNPLLVTVSLVDSPFSLIR